MKSGNMNRPEDLPEKHRDSDKLILKHVKRYFLTFREALQRVLSRDIVKSCGLE